MNNKLINDLGDLCKHLKLLNNKKYVSQALCAYAAISGDDKETKVDLSYTYIMRKLRKEKDDDRTKKFQIAFKNSFEKALDENIENPADIALMTSIKEIGWEEDA